MNKKEYDEKVQILKTKLRERLGDEKHYGFYDELLSHSDLDFQFKVVYPNHTKPFHYFRSALVSYVCGNTLGCLAYCVVAIDTITAKLVTHIAGEGAAFRKNGREEPLRTMFNILQKKQDNYISLPKNVIESFEYIISARHSLAHPAHKGLDNILKKDDDYSILRKMLKITIELLREFYSILEKSPPK